MWVGMYKFGVVCKTEALFKKKTRTEIVSLLKIFCISSERGV